MQISERQNAINKNTKPKKYFGFIILFCSIFLFFGLSTTANAAYDGWLYKSPLTDSNSTNLANFATKVSLTSGNFTFSHAKSDGSDIRVWDETAGAAVPLWIESWDSTAQKAVIWIKPVSTAHTISLYYGNAGASSPSSFTNVFTHGSDFTGTTGDLTVASSTTGSLEYLTPNLGYTNPSYWNSWQATATPVLSAPAGYAFIRDLAPTRDLNDKLVFDGNGNIVAYPCMNDSSAIGNIGRTTSPDGFTWSTPSVVWSGTSSATSHQGASVLKFGSSDYRMWFSDGYNAGTKTLRMSTSTDNLNWSASSAVLSSSSFNTPTPGGVFVPWVTPLSDGSLVMLFESQSGDLVFRIYGATSTDGGYTWTPLNSGAPVLNLGAAGTFDAGGVANPELIELSVGNYLLSYNGRTANNAPWSIGYATATSLSGPWTRYVNNPTAMGGKSSSYGLENSAIAKDPTTPGKLWHWIQDAPGDYKTAQIWWAPAWNTTGLRLQSWSNTGTAFVGNTLSDMTTFVMETMLYPTGASEGATNSRSIFFDLINSATAPIAGTYAGITHVLNVMRTGPSDTIAIPNEVFVDRNTGTQTQYWNGSTWSTTVAAFPATRGLGLLVRLTDDGTNYNVHVEDSTGVTIFDASTAKAAVHNTSAGRTFLVGDPYTDTNAEQSILKYVRFRPYAATEPNITLGIEQATTPTLSVTNSPVTYNTSPQVATVSGSVAGVVSNIQYNGSGTVPTNAGTYAITADFAPTDSADYNSLTGASAGNFVINTANQGTLTAISTPSTVPYGTTATLSSSGGSGTGAVTFSIGASTGCNITGGTTLNVSNPAGTCTVTATKATDTNYNSATSAGLSVTLTKGTQATLTVTGLPASAVYQQAGITAGTSGGSGTGAVTFSAGASTACSINSSTGAVAITAASGSCLITATKATDTNYNSATSGSVSIAVGTASQTITVTTPAPASATYNGTFPVAATSSSGLTVSITTNGGCTISTGTVTMTSGTTACTVYYDQAGNGSYSAASQVQSITTAVLATQSTITTISTPSTVAYGTTSTLSSSGGSGTGAVTFSVGASTGCNITGGTTLNVNNASGTCTVTATKAADTNYNSATSAGLSVTLTKATQSTLTFTGQTVTSPTTFSALSTTGGSGTGTVTYAVTTAGTAGCSIVGTTLSYTTVGTCGVTATKATDPNYNAVSSSEATFTINAPTAHTITVTSGSNGTITPGTTSVNNGSDQAFTITANSGYHIDTVTADSVAVSATSPYTFTNVTANHTISATFAADTVVVTGGGPLVSGGNGAPVGLINGSGSHRQDISNLLAPAIPVTSTTTIISGCNNGTNGFSITTGQSCLGNTSDTTTTILPTLPKYNFTRNLSLHSTGKDVKALQQYLNTHGFIISKTGAGSPGKETSLFGTLTYKALVKFQKSLGWSGTGFFGPMTRDYINKQ